MAEQMVEVPFLTDDMLALLEAVDVNVAAEDAAEALTKEWRTRRRLERLDALELSLMHRCVMTIKRAHGMLRAGQLRDDGSFQWKVTRPGGRGV